MEDQKNKGKEIHELNLLDLIVMFFQWIKKYVYGCLSLFYGQYDLAFNIFGLFWRVHVLRWQWVYFLRNPLGLK